MSASSFSPDFIYRRRNANDPDKHTLTDAEYAALQQLIVMKDYEPMTLTSGELVLDSDGLFMYRKI